MSTRDNVYVNVTINSDFSTKTTPFTQQVAEYDSTNNQPILLKCDDFYCSVLRFDFPLNAVPIMIMPIDPQLNVFPISARNPNLTPFIIGINFLGVNYFEQLIFSPATNVYPVPTNLLTPQAPYYWVYSYQNLIQMMNTALSALWVSSGLSALPFNAPYIVLDSATGLMSFIVPSPFAGTAGGKPIIYMNEATLQYFDAFKVFWYGYNRPNGRDYDLIFDYTTTPWTANGQNVHTTTTIVSVVGPTTITDTNTVVTSDYYIFTQEYSTLAFWSPLRKILITTNSIPIAYEWTLAGQSLDTQFPVLTDFVPQLAFAGDTRSIAHYVPTSQYRLVDMQSASALQKIDVKVFWETTSGNIFPLIIAEFQQINIKLGFLRKSLYKPMNMLLG